MNVTKIIPSNSGITIRQRRIRKRVKFKVYIVRKLSHSRRSHEAAAATTNI
jgi:hypothetical protein